jgi:hypothetical protein
MIMVGYIGIAAFAVVMGWQLWKLDREIPLQRNPGPLPKPSRPAPPMPNVKPPRKP